METIPERLDWLWVLGYDLNAAILNHSVLSKARRRWGPAVFQRFFEHIVWQWVEAGMVDERKIFVDASLVEAHAANSSIVDTHSLKRHLSERYKQLEARLGLAVLAVEHQLFARWYRVREGTLPWADFQGAMLPLMARVGALLREGAAGADAKTQATCRKLLKLEAALWTFVWESDVEPTNNRAEVRLVGQKPSTQRVWGNGPGAMRTMFSRPQNLIPVSVEFRPSEVTD